MNQLRKYLATALLVGAGAAPAAAQSAPRDSGLILSSVIQAVTRPLDEPEQLSVVVDLSERSMTVMDGDREIRRYPVSVGTQSYPTPQGQFNIARMIWNPAWRPPASAWARHRKPEGPGSPGNPMGRVKIFFREPDFYIHGTGAASSLGRPASHGCIRLRNADAADLARLLMASGGAERDETWFRQVVEESGVSRPVSLRRPVPLRIRA